MSIDDTQKGTGGLTFEPPTSSTHGGNFAADLGSESDAETIAKLFDAPSSPAPSKTQPEPTSTSPSQSNYQSQPTSYPRSEAAFDVLLKRKSTGPDSPMPVFIDEPNDDDDKPLSAFQVGPSIAMKKNDVVSTPPKPTQTSTDSPSEHDMLDAYFIGEGDDDSSQIHLTFKEDVLGGVHVVLEKASEGLFARFIVADANTRRHIESSVHVLLQRLTDRGMKVSGYSVTTRDAC